MTPLAAQQQILHGTWQEAMEAIDWLVEDAKREKELKEWEVAVEGDTLLALRPGGAVWHRIEPDGSCDCPGFKYRGRCSHRRAIEELAKKGVEDEV